MNVSHHDVSRQGVGRTAFAVAHLRALESLKPAEERLIYDPYAILIHEKEPEQDDLLGTKEKLLRMVDGGAVRTRKIDEEIVIELRKEDYKNGLQIVVIGAGLDFRPFRLHSYLEGQDSAGDVDRENRIKWFEIDFQEIFDYKLPYTTTPSDSSSGIPSQKQHKSYFNYIPVSNNAAIENWQDNLLLRGFNPSFKTIWLLEGFTGYLEEEECRSVFKVLTSLSAVGSKIIATFLGPDCQSGLTMHRFKTNQPLLFLLEFGKWSQKDERGVQYHFPDLMKYYSRDNCAGGEAWNDYYLIVSYLEQ